MKRRHLKPDELELWNKVAATAEKLNPRQAMKSALETEPAPVPVAEPRGMPQFDTVPKRIKGKAAPLVTRDVLRPIADRVAAGPVHMDRKSFDQMKRGKIRPEARIDLHGMTLDRAHPALTRFILSSHGGGKRLVLVITGKGKERDEGGPIPVRHGVLRHQVPQWLGMAPLSPLILQITPAHLRHGGTGAYYVYLRKRR